MLMLMAGCVAACLGVACSRTTSSKITHVAYMAAWPPTLGVRILFVFKTRRCRSVAVAVPRWLQFLFSGSVDRSVASCEATCLCGCCRRHGRMSCCGGRVACVSVSMRWAGLWPDARPCPPVVAEDSLHWLHASVCPSYHADTHKCSRLFLICFQCSHMFCRIMRVMAARRQISCERR